MSWRIVVGGVRSDCSALPTGHDEKQQLLIPYRSNGRRIVGAERTRAQFDGLHAASIFGSRPWTYRAAFGTSHDNELQVIISNSGSDRLIVSAERTWA
jgi:hypothetical protein